MKRIAQTIVFWGVLLALWEMAVTYFKVQSYLMPPPSAIFRAAWEVHPQMMADTWVTTVEVLTGFVAAVAGGLVIGVVISYSALARRTLYPLVTALQSMPKIALAPLMIVWFGYGFASKLASTFLFAFFPVVVATMGGLASVARNLDEHFRALGASPWDTFWRLYLPAALPAFADGLKIAMPLAVIGAIVGEFIGSEEGLGHLIVFASAAARTDVMFAAILMVTLLAVALYWVIERLARFVWWRGINV
ncbi:nitrate ABC transporter permease [Pandoraea captiosa]|uniref:Nitrate ABC transporter permease n=1 Tax=Pandoraea captiosa TaxID=2508302 RepID=A0A5E4ZK83_9BURK|nr:ABC transporter permease [Pandoraea captiosa]VVE61771.1 nitrate ABC transporter permease [Pandoraea captiosa]